jgi:biotin carboxylase
VERTLLLVGAGLMGGGYVTAARRLGLQVVLVDHPDRQTEYGPLVDRFHECPDPADQAWLSAALDAAESARPDAVLAFSEPQVLAAAWVQHRLGLPGPSLPAAQASRDKAIQRVLLRRAGVGQPDFHIATAPAAALDWARSRYPVVVKQLRGAGSTGVRLARHERELQPLLTAGWAAETMLVEEYVDAPEYSVEALVQEGRVRFSNVTAKQTSGPPEFVELGHQVPAPLPAPERAALAETLAAAVTALGVDTALVHLELRWDRGRARVMETALRTPGDYLVDLLCLAYQHDFYESMVRLALGEPVEVPASAVAEAAVGFLTAPPGVLRCVHGAEAAGKLPGVVKVDLERGPGDRVPDLRSSEDRIGCIIATGTAGHARRLVADALATIRLDVQ